MNPVFKKVVNCFICNENMWEHFSNVERVKISFTLTICKNCGFVIQNPPLSDVFLNNYYKNDYVRKNYNNTINNIYQNTISDVNKRIRHLADEKFIGKFNKALEIGPGAGTMMKSLSDKGIDIIGIEPDMEAVNWIESNLRLPIYQGFFDEVYEREKNNWYNSLYDTILMFHVLEHVTDLSVFLNKIKNIMTNDGLLIIEVPNIRRPYSDEYRWEKYCDPGHLYYFSKNSLTNVLTKAGFRILSIVDNIIEPYGNLFCVAKSATTIKKLQNHQKLSDKSVDIKNIWDEFTRNHKYRIIQHKYNRLKMKFNKGKI